MMGQLAAQKDVESLEMSRGTRSRCCLDAFLVTSVVFLFLAVAAVAAVVVMTQPRPILNRPDATSAAEEERAERAPSLQNFAYLQATQSKYTFHVCIYMNIAKQLKDQVAGFTTPGVTVGH